MKIRENEGDRRIGDDERIEFTENLEDDRSAAYSKSIDDDRSAAHSKSIEDDRRAGHSKSIEDGQSIEYNRRIENYVWALFADTQGKRDISYTKEELLATLNKRYDDLIAAGKSEDEAFALVVSGIEDIDSLLIDVAGPEGDIPLEAGEKKSRRRGFLNKEYRKTYDTFVENQKAILSSDKKRRKLRGALSSSLWMLIVMLYFALSFFTGSWHLTWLIFIFGACLQQIIGMMFSKPGKRKRFKHGILWTTSVIVYFLFSFTTNRWAWSWLIFPATAAIQQILRLLSLWGGINNDDS